MKCCAELKESTWALLPQLRITTPRKVSPFTSGYFELLIGRICLAGSVLDNLQGFGLGQKEQLFEEFGGGPELLAASL